MGRFNHALLFTLLAFAFPAFALASTTGPTPAHPLPVVQTADNHVTLIVLRPGLHNIQLLIPNKDEWSTKLVQTGTGREIAVCPLKAGLQSNMVAVGYTKSGVPKIYDFALHSNAHVYRAIVRVSSISFSAPRKVKRL